MPKDEDPNEANNFAVRIVQQILRNVKAQSIHIGQITQTIVYLGLPLNDRHLRFVRLLTNSAYLTCLVWGFIRLWQNGADLTSLLLLIVGSGLLSLTCLYYAGFWKPKGQDKGALMVRRLATVGVLAVPLLTYAGFFIWRSLPAPHVLLLVADFDSVEQQNYQVTENILWNLRNYTKRYADIKVQALSQSITEQQGSEVARNLGEQKKASIVIWGSYGVTETNVQIGVHFEVLKPPDYFPKLEKPASGEAQTSPLSELNSFKLQTRLSNEMSYLTLFTLGMVQYAKDDWDGAVERFKSALELVNEPATTLGQEAVHFYLGNAYFKQGKYPQAIDDYNTTLHLKPDYATDIYHNRGLAYFKQGKYPQAIEDYDKTLKLKPDFAQAYYNRGDAYLKQGNYNQAFDDFNSALKLKPNYAAAYHGRGLAYSSLGKYPQAIEDYDKTLKLKPNYADVYHNRGLAYSSLGKYPQAIEDYDKTLKLKPDFAQAYYNRGNAYLKQGNYNQAFDDFNSALKLKPNYAAAYHGRGLAYSSLGKYPQAIEDYDKTLKLKPNYAAAYYNKARAFSLEKEVKAAIENLQRAVDLDAKLRENAKTDSAFDNIRQNKQFQALVGQ